jgi:hypothetical protein
MLVLYSYDDSYGVSIISEKIKRQYKSYSRIYDEEYEDILENGIKVGSIKRYKIERRKQVLNITVICNIPSKEAIKNYAKLAREIILQKTLSE